MTARDPRVDPRPGDVMETKYGTRRTVEKRAGPRIVYLYESGLLSRKTSCWLRQWQDWASTATIISRGPDD